MIQHALQRWMDDEGLTLVHVAEVAKSSHTSVRRWLEGAKVRKKYLDLLLPHLEKYSDEKELEKNVPFQIKEAYELLKRTISNKHLTWLATQNLRNIVNTFDAISDDRPQKEEPKVINFEVAEDAIPYLTQEVSAGNGIEVLEERYHNKPDMHYMTVKGESMEPTYKDGDKIIIQRFFEPVIFGDQHIPIEFVKNIVPEDSVIIYNRNDTGLSMKRVKYENKQNAWYFKLTADNKDWAIEHKFNRIVKKSDDFVIYGKVIGKESK